MDTIAQESARLPKWIHPWDKGHADNIYNRDDRFFSLLVKAALAWLTNTISLYGKPVKHFVLNTGSSYMYVETNGYGYCANEVSGEDAIYLERPRCIVTMNSIQIPSEELTQNGIRASYERLADGKIQGFNAEIKRIPVNMQLDLHYVLSTFNEELTLAQEIIDKLLFQRYFSFIYLGQVIEASVSFPDNIDIKVGQIDMTSSDTNRNNIDISVNIETNYPRINEASESPNSSVMRTIKNEIKLTKSGDIENVLESEEHLT